MSELIEDIREDIKREDLINIWQRYGKYIVVGIAIFILGISGFLYWQHHQKQIIFANAQAYSRFITAVNEKSSEATLTELRKALGDKSPGYRFLTGLIETEASSHKGRDLKQIAEDPKIEKNFQDIALILSAMADLDEGNLQHILNRLAPFESSASPFRPLALEIMGHTLLKGGDIRGAQAVFDKLVQDQTAASSHVRNRAQAMLDYINGSRP